MDVSERRWPWVVVLIVAVAAPLLAFGSWTGFCVDSAEASQTFCMTGPLIGWPAAWAVTALCAVVVVYALFRLMRNR